MVYFGWKIKKLLYVNKIVITEVAVLFFIYFLLLLAAMKNA
jgi:hypothetical protein